MTIFTQYITNVNQITELKTSHHCIDETVMPKDLEGFIKRLEREKPYFDCVAFLMTQPDKRVRVIIPYSHKFTAVSGG